MRCRNDSPARSGIGDGQQCSRSAAHVCDPEPLAGAPTSSLPAIAQSQKHTCHSRMLVSQLTRRAMTCWSSRVSWLLLPLPLATCRTVSSSELVHQQMKCHLLQRVPKTAVLRLHTQTSPCCGVSKLARGTATRRLCTSAGLRSGAGSSIAASTALFTCRSTASPVSRHTSRTRSHGPKWKHASGAMTCESTHMCAVDLDTIQRAIFGGSVQLRAIQWATDKLLILRGRCCWCLPLPCRQINCFTVLHDASAPIRVCHRS